MDKDKTTIPVVICNTVVVGSGAAGFNAADRLYQYGQTDVVIVTEGVNMGTSRNTGSDKQTYYKLTLSGDGPDSVREMAETLFDGQCVDGDLALCEAALSTQSFLRLVELGVPFPRNRYGEFVGYKTDHDPRCRATSVGPYTSKLMTEALERSVRGKGIPILDGLLAIDILSDGGKACGLLCLDMRHLDDPQRRFAAVCCYNIIWATGGPAGMYADSVYPLGHTGSTGAAFAAGAKGKNLTEWQFGLASVRPRWNVSGTYMQVLPRFVSTDLDGGDEREFLYDFFTDEGELLTKVFLKGYQWPFDVRKVADGSSVIDILVYLEQKKGRRVFLDFRSNPGGKSVAFESLSAEAREYLEKAGACFGTPLERLMCMNAPAVDFYRDRGVDLRHDMLEIALCAQHNNGGLSIDCWWQTNVEGLFAVGEAAASHGVYRPGGSALNAGQVGSTRAAQYIAARRTSIPDEALFDTLLTSALERAQALCAAVYAPTGPSTVERLTREASTAMSRLGGAIRSEASLRALLEQINELWAGFSNRVRIQRPSELGKVFRLRDTILAQRVYAEAMLDYLTRGGKSRGSALYTDPNGQHPLVSLPEEFTFVLENGVESNVLQEVTWEDNTCRFVWRPARPIPEEDDFFENVWRSYRENQNIE